MNSATYSAMQPSALAALNEISFKSTFNRYHSIAMTLDADSQKPYSPRPLRSVKQSIDRIDPDCAPAYEHVWPQPPASLPTPSPTYDPLSKAPRSSSAPRNYKPNPLSSCSTSFPSDRPTSLRCIRQSSAPPQSRSVGLLKRALEDGDVLVSLR